MSIDSSLFSHAATVLPVHDVDASIAFYRDQLGFQLTFTWKEAPTEYAVLKAGNDVSLHLTLRRDGLTPSPDHTILHVFVHDVDQLYQAYQQREVPIVTPIGDREYNMRDFDIKDPDGHIICFGKG